MIMTSSDQPPVQWIRGRTRRVTLVDTPRRVLVDPRMADTNEQMVRVVIPEGKRWAVREEGMGIGLLGYLPPDVKLPQHCVVVNHRVLPSGDVIVRLCRAPATHRVLLCNSNWSPAYPESLRQLRIPRQQRIDRLQVYTAPIDFADTKMLIIIDSQTGYSVGMLPPPSSCIWASWLDSDKNHRIWVAPDWHISPAPAIEVRLLPVWAGTSTSDDADDV